MITANITPPWEAVDNGDGSWTVVSRVTGRVVCTVFEVEQARLIAQAPELLRIIEPSVSAEGSTIGSRATAYAKAVGLSR